MVRWLPATAVLLAAVALLSDSPGPVSVALGAVVLVLAWMFSPLFFPRSPGDSEGRRRAAAEGRPLVYWRPGCSYCFRLRISLGLRAGEAVWVDVTTDTDASARVRAANGGDETVPTVVVGDETVTNPAPAWVRARLP
ncbi:MAG: hypothetical protein CMH83_02250 [Nocardioides sp.]|nr:hypothetical protein [Nocardioides sp.]